jgi:hypothetical protein
MRGCRYLSETQLRWSKLYVKKVHICTSVINNNQLPIVNPRKHEMCIYFAVIDLMRKSLSNRWRLLPLEMKRMNPVSVVLGDIYRLSGCDVRMRPRPILTGKVGYSDPNSGSYNVCCFIGHAFKKFTNL